MKSYYNQFLCGLLIVSALSCSRMNDLHDPYLKDGEIMYTGKVDSAKVFGDEQRVTLRYWTSDPKAKNLLVYWNLGTESKQFAIPEKKAEDPVDVVIDDLDAGDVYFELFTLNDKMQNKSVPYQVDGYVYKDMSQETWRNRLLNNIAVVTEGDETFLMIVWGTAKDTEIGVKLDYTDIHGESRSMMVANTETTTTIRDINTGEPVFCTTLHKVAPYASNTYYSPTVELQHSVSLDLTHLLKNTSAPFAKGNVVKNRFYEILGWETNPAGAANGNVDTYGPFNDGLCFPGWFIAIPGEGIVQITNGKLYQTVELEAGRYSFDVEAIFNHATQTYIVVALGNDVPDINNFGGALVSFNIPDISEGSSVVFENEFVLSKQSTVSLGFVTSTGDGEVVFSKVELWRK